MRNRPKSLPASMTKDGRAMPAHRALSRIPEGLTRPRASPRSQATPSTPTSSASLSERDGVLYVTIVATASLLMPRIWTDSLMESEKLDYPRGPVPTVPALNVISPRKTRFVKTALLVVSAVLLSTLLPASWTSLGFLSPVSLAPTTSLAEPGEQWKDDIWPLREQTPWDISTDFPYPRLLEYDVTEGTWLRLDVNPTTGEIVFDMLGDLYCLPKSAYGPAALASDALSRAVPILTGVPHDSDPHFSPDGTRIVFRSDAGLGVENIWMKPWKGCEAMDVRPAHPTGEQYDALQVKQVEEDSLASGVAETADRKRRRLLREGRLDGASRCMISHARIHGTQLGASPTRRTVGSATRDSTPRARRSSRRNGSRPREAWEPGKDGSSPSPSTARVISLSRARGNCS